MGRHFESDERVVPERLKARIKLLGIRGQDDAADRCGVSVGTYAKAEQGKPITFETLRLLAQGLECKVEDLVAPIRHTLPAVLARFLAWEDNVGGADGPLQLDAIGIDMTDGENFLYRAASGRASARIDFRILMLDGPSERLKCLRNNVDERIKSKVGQWSTAGVDNLNKIIGRVNGETLGSRGSSIRVTVCKYDEVPTLHGLRASKGENRMYALTECYFTDVPPSIYEWGWDRYVIEEFSDVAAQSDKAKSWDELFDRLWEPAKESPAWKWPKNC